MNVQLYPTHLNISRHIEAVWLLLPHTKRSVSANVAVSS